MTVCIAALCDDATKVVIAADRMLTGSDVEFEQDIRKFEPITSIQSNSRCQMLHRVSRDATVGERVELWEEWHPWFRRSTASS